jgi:hypothetical protein
MRKPVAVVAVQVGTVLMHLLLELLRMVALAVQAFQIL